ncbi:hypothetical protein [Cereibacter azotoformans]|nr:hypothetical protein [Cereibacter azotoformans]
MRKGKERARMKLAAAALAMLARQECKAMKETERQMLRDLDAA